MTSRAPEPPDGDEPAIALGWLDFHRDALAAKCAGLTPEQLTTRSCPPSRLTLLGLVRHLVEMERAYGAWAVGPPGPHAFVWGEGYDDDGPEWDFDVDASMVEASLTAWERERAATDRAVGAATGPEHVGANGRSLRWNLAKLVGEYARHNGHADLLREALDGATGE